MTKGVFNGGITSVLECSLESWPWETAIPKDGRRFLEVIIVLWLRTSFSNGFKAGFHQLRRAAKLSSLMFVNAWHNWWKQKFVLRCATLHKNERDLAAVGSSKENMFLRAFGWNRNWLISECDLDISEKNISTKKRKVPRKRHHWVTPLFKSTADVFAERCTFFSKYFEKKRKVIRKCVIGWHHYSKVQMTFSQNVTLFLRNILKKKRESSPKTCHWVTLLFKSTDDVFAELCGVFFQNILEKNIWKKAQSSAEMS